MNSLESLRNAHGGGNLKDENETLKVIAAIQKQFHASIADDFNTPRSLALLNELLHYANTLLDKRLLSKRAAKMIVVTILEFGRVLGLDFKKARKLKIPEAVQQLVEKRESLRKEKKWKEADKIREKIRALGYVIEDTPSGPTVKKKTAA